MIPLEMEGYAYLRRKGYLEEEIRKHEAEIYELHEQIRILEAEARGEDPY
jgi:hypothetical protein